MVALLALHAVIGVGVLIRIGALGRRGFVIGAIAPVAMLLWAMTQAGAVLAGNAVTQDVTWVGGLGLAVDLRLDAFALLMIVLVSGIGTLVFVYALRYFGDTPSAGRAAGLLDAVRRGDARPRPRRQPAGAVRVLGAHVDHVVPADRQRRRRAEEARAAALHALLVTGHRAGWRCSAGFVLLGQEAGTFRISELLADPPSGTTVAVALVLVLVGAFTKSAQYPFHSWLPGAMVAPTPISAYLHSATMVKAGVYLVARFAPAFADVGVVAAARRRRSGWSR